MLAALGAGINIFAEHGLSVSRDKCHERRIISRVGNHDDVVDGIVIQFIRAALAACRDDGHNGPGSEVDHLYVAVPVPHIKLIFLGDGDYSVWSTGGTTRLRRRDSSRKSKLRRSGGNGVQKRVGLRVDHVDPAGSTGSGARSEER